MIRKNAVYDIVSAVAVSIVLITILLIPLRIIAYGFLPRDDALRHASKVVSGKNWNEILVLRPEIKMDSHPGWHAILSFVRGITGCNQDGLVVFSVVFLFVVFCLVPLFFLKYGESWLITLLIANLINTYFIWRLLIGRPFILTIASVLTLCFLWPKLAQKKPSYPAMMLLIFLLALSTWIHGGCWYLLVLPIGCFFLARQWRAAIRISTSAAIGVLLGASLTGHPFVFLKQSLFGAFWAFSGKPLQRMLVVELRAFAGDPVTVIIVGIMLLWRALRGEWDIKRIDNPVFMLMVAAWILGFSVWRFWLDWGMIAFMAWITQEFQDIIRHYLKTSSWQRVALALVVALPLYLSVTNDSSNRCTWNLNLKYLSQDDPALASWLPEAGGIIYSDDMGIFYQTFFNNPRAPWRYVFGFEPTWMPDEDLAVFRNIQWNYGAGEAFAPWVIKMRPQDRLMIRRSGGAPPNIEGLEWHYTGIEDTWIGRLPRK